MLDEAIEIHRSLRRIDCDRRAFVLTAVGIPNEVAPLPTWHGWSLWVESARVAEARAQLDQYQAEQRGLRAMLWQKPPQPVRPWAWLGSLGYVLTLLAVAAAVNSDLIRLDAFDVGALEAAKVQSGQWWRAWTALTLHLGADHLVANLSAGAWFGYLAGQLLGPGASWLLIVFGAGCANLVEGLVASPDHRSVGASTAVFATLGLLAGWSWHERRHLGPRWLTRLGPLVAGVMLLGWLGTAGEHTDIMAHLLGFVVGTALGVGIAHWPALTRMPQWLSGAGALLILALAWTCALVN